MFQLYLAPLTWLRAFAAFLVVASHIVRVCEESYSEYDEPSYFLPFNMFDLGEFGVCLFFALSGCTLFISSRNSLRTHQNTLPFYIKRFMRIWPTFAVSLVVFIVFREVFANFYTSDKLHWVDHLLHDYKPQDVFLYLSLTFNFTGPSGLFNGVYWSLPVEFQYYLLLPICISLMRTKLSELLTPIMFSIGLYILYLTIPNAIGMNRSEVLHLGFSFFGGVFLASVHQRFSFRIPFALALFIFCALFLYTAFVRTAILPEPNNVLFIHDNWNFYGVMALACVAVTLLTNAPRFDNRLFRFIHNYGEISYSIYLFHMLFVGIAALLVINLKLVGDFQKMFFVANFVLIGSYLFSRLTYTYIEKPSIELGKRMSEIYRKRSVVNR